MKTAREQSRLHGGRYLSVTLLLLIAPAALHAFTLESLLMPGPVAESHAEYEDDCEQCHTETEEQNQNTLCVGCHIAIGTDVMAGEGLHGRHPDAGDNQCASCHTDHEGRDADMVAFDLSEFDHSRTDFALRGVHDWTLCADCHQPGDKWMTAPNTCSSCHGHEDVHQGQMAGTCGDCHNETTWRDASFDHDTTTFSLTGGHGAAACGDCHQDQVFHGVPTDCNGCHVDDDAHMGRNGPQCESCHSSVDWVHPEFDHVAVSGFPLLGAHEPLACETCHTQDLMTALPTSCHGCHQSDDVHQGGLGTDCGSCHRVSNWTRTGFDHSQIDRFPLLGAHNELECTSCHVEGTDVGLPVDCVGCHSDDPHVEQLGSRCETCHTEMTWTGDVRFDHGLTHFPLIGAHEAIGCETCHATPAFHDAAEDCQGCHSSEDVHAGRLGTRCETCHNPTDWTFWTFDHDTQTDFMLTGAHIGAACTACHRESTTDVASVPNVCEACHRRDDPHMGRFGADCADCHTTGSFSDIQGF